MNATVWAIIGTVVTSAGLFLRWYFSKDAIKKRKVRDGQKALERMREALSKRDGDVIHDQFDELL